MKKKIVAFLLLISTQLFYYPVPTAFAAQTATVSASYQEAAHLLAVNLASLINSDPTSIIPITSSTQALVKSNFPSGFTSEKDAIILQKLARGNFKADEDVTFTITNPTQEHISPVLIDPQGKSLQAAITQMVNGSAYEFTVTRPIQFRPGKYKIQVTDNSGKTSEQDFTWGVLALNTDRSIYQPGQTADLSMAVLDDQGNMVCDANLTLQITNASTNTNDVLSTKNGKITGNPACKSHNFSLVPDYEAHYQVGNTGSYAINFTAETKNGTYSIADKLTVENYVPLDVQRVSATRIYPPNNYSMQFHITANQDFEGTVTETVPDSFTITPSDQTASSSSYENMQTMYLSQKKDPGVDLEKNIRSVSASALPLPFSGSFRITQGFGEQLTDTTLRKYYATYGLGGNDGVDFGLPTGTPIFAVDDGNVVFAGQGDYGTTVIIQHSWGRSYYGNLSMVTVDAGNHVTNGTLIGYSGDSSETIGPHLHFGIKPNNPDINNGYMGKVDPLPYFHLPETATSAFDFLSPDLQNIVLHASTPATLQIDTQTTTASVAGTDASSSAKMPITVLANQLKKDIQKTTTTDNKVKIISWHLALKKGQSTTLSYTFKVPPVSPQFYLLGPLRFFDKDSEMLAFEEQRNWQIASDAVGTPWYSDGTKFGGYNWQYRKQITVDHTKVGGVSFDAASPVQHANGSSISWTHTVANQSNRLLIVTVSYSGSPAVSSSVKYNNVAMTEVNGGTTACGNASLCNAEMWYLKAPATGSNTVQITVSGGPADYVAGSSSYYNVDQTTPLGNSNTASTSNASTISTTVSSTNTNQIVVDSYSDNNFGGSAAAGQTQLYEDNTVIAGGSSYKTGGSSSTTMTWNNNSSTDSYALIAVAINPASQTNFPVLVNLASDNDLKANAQSTGNDILFTDSTGQTKLNHEIESYTSGTGALVAWVQIPTVSASSDTIIYMYYGNGSAANQQNASGVWDSNYLGVWHMSDNAANTTVADSSSHANTGTNAANTSTKTTTGEIASGLTYNGTSDNTNTTSAGSINGQAQVTISAWVNFSALDSTQRVIYEEVTNANSSTKRISLNIGGGGCTANKLCLNGRTNDGDGQTLFVQNTTSLSTNTWYYVVAVYDSTNSINHLMINGVDQTNSRTEGAFSSTTPFHTPEIGEEPDGSHFFSGTLDEVRISKTAWDVGRNTTEYNNQSSPSTFYTLGSVETHGFACTLDQKMRHGACFSNGKLQPFGW